MAFRFCRAQRILKTDEFSSVFRLRAARSNAWFQVYAAPNNTGHARLGLAVSKKVARRAVRRNYVKRTVREVFRQHQAAYGAVDFVVRAKQPLIRAQHAEAKIALLALFAKLASCRVSSSR